MIPRFASLLALLAFGACASPTSTELDQKRLDPTHAETPFTAREIRDGCPAGRYMRTQITEPGKAPVFQVTQFLGGDEVHARMQGWIEDERGRRRPEKPQPMQAKWIELQSHASFPAIFTKITEESVEVPAGRFDCLHYKIERENEGKVYGLHFWFAKELPGPPVKQLRVLDGKPIRTVVLLENETP